MGDGVYANVQTNGLEGNVLENVENSPLNTQQKQTGVVNARTEQDPAHH